MKLFKFLIKRNKLGGKQMTLEEIKKAIMGLSDEEKATLMETFTVKENGEAEEVKEEVKETELENTPVESITTESHPDVEADEKMLEPILAEIANIKSELQAMKQSVIKEKQSPQKAPDEEADKLNKIAAKYSSD